uniref:Uncharacterized protein n=1 Tax=Romanomermis culicivorax TaxID=13658 RepID=A0A915INS3_ROMCU
MREKTSSLDVQVAQLRKENQALWNEVGSLRQNQSKQQGLVNNLIQILSSFAQGQQQQNKSRPSRGQLLAIEHGTILGSRLLNQNCSNNSDIDENLVTTLKISDVTHEYETKKDTPKLCSGGYDNIRYNSDSSLNGNNVPNEKEDLINGYSKVPSPNDSRISIYSNVSVENDSAMDTDWTNTELPPKNTLIDETSNCDYDDSDDVNKLRNSLSTAGQRFRFDQDTAANLFNLAENSNKTAKMGEEQYGMTGLRSSLLSAPPCMHTLTVGAPGAAAAFFQRQASVPCYVSYATMPTNTVSQTPPVSAVAAHQRVGGRLAMAVGASAADFHMAIINDGPNIEQVRRKKDN